MGSAGNLPAASPSPPCSSENVFTAPSQSYESLPDALYSKSTSLTFHWKLWGRHRGRRRSLAHPKNHLSPQEGGVTPQVPSPCCRFDSPRGPPPPRLGLLGALMAEDGVRGSPPVPSGPPMEEDGLRWTPKSPLDPDSGKVGMGQRRAWGELRSWETRSLLLW